MINNLLIDQLDSDYTTADLSRLFIQVLTNVQLIHIDLEKPTAAPTQPAAAERVELRVVVSPEILHVQRGRTYEITCGVYGADASTAIYWIQEEPERVNHYCFSMLIRIYFAYFSFYSVML